MAEYEILQDSAPLTEEQMNNMSVQPEASVSPLSLQEDEVGIMVTGPSYDPTKRDVNAGRLFGKNALDATFKFLYDNPATADRALGKQLAESKDPLMQEIVKQTGVVDELTRVSEKMTAKSLALRDHFGMTEEEITPGVSPLGWQKIVAGLGGAVPSMVITAASAGAGGALATAAGAGEKVVKGAQLAGAAYASYSMEKPVLEKALMDAGFEAGFADRMSTYYAIPVAMLDAGSFGFLTRVMRPAAGAAVSTTVGRMMARGFLSPVGEVAVGALGEGVTEAIQGQIQTEFEVGLGLQNRDFQNDLSSRVVEFVVGALMGGTVGTVHMSGQLQARKAAIEDTYQKYKDLPGVTRSSVAEAYDASTLAATEQILDELGKDTVDALGVSVNERAEQIQKAIDKAQGRETVNDADKVEATNRQLMASARARLEAIETKEAEGITLTDKEKAQKTRLQQRVLRLQDQVAVGGNMVALSPRMKMITEIRNTFAGGQKVQIKEIGQVHEAFRRMLRGTKLSLKATKGVLKNVLSIKTADEFNAKQGQVIEAIDTIVNGERVEGLRDVARDILDKATTIGEVNPKTIIFSEHLTNVFNGKVPASEAPASDSPLDLAKYAMETLVADLAENDTDVEAATRAVNALKDFYLGELENRLTYQARIAETDKKLADTITAGITKGKKISPRQAGLDSVRQNLKKTGFLRFLFPTNLIESFLTIANDIDAGQKKPNMQGTMVREFDPATAYRAWMTLLHRTREAIDYKLAEIYGPKFLETLTLNRTANFIDVEFVEPNTTEEVGGPFLIDTTPEQQEVKWSGGTIQEAIGVYGLSHPFTLYAINKVPGMRVIVKTDAAFEADHPANSSAAAVYSPSQKAIIVREQVKNNPRFMKTVLRHELVHGLVTEQIQTYRRGKLDQLTPGVRQSIEKIHGLFELTRRELEKVTLAEEDKAAVEYAMQNMDEFVAVALSSKRFRNILDGIRLPTKKVSVFHEFALSVQKIWEAILAHSRVDAPSVYSEILKQTLNIAEGGDVISHKRGNFLPVRRSFDQITGESLYFPVDLAAEEKVTEKINITKGAAMSLYMMQRNAKIRSQMIKMGYSEEWLDAFAEGNVFTAQDHAWMNQVDTILKSYAEQVAPIFEKLTGRPFRAVDNYFMIQRYMYSEDISGDEVASVVKAMMDGEFDAVDPSNDPRFKKRVMSKKEFIVPDITEAITRYSSDMNHFIAYAEYAYKLKALLGNAEFISALEAHAPEGTSTVLNTFLKHLVDGSQSRGSDRAAMRSQFTVLGWLARNKIASPRSGFMQFTALAGFTDPTSSTPVTPVELAQGVVSLFQALRSGEAKDLLDTGYMQERWLGAFDQASKMAEDMARFGIFSGQGRLDPGGVLKKIGTNKMLQEWITLSTRLGDRAPSLLGGWTVYQRVLKQTGDKVQAVTAAIKMIEEVNGSLDPGKSAEIYQSNTMISTLFKLFTRSTSIYLDRYVRMHKAFAAGQITKGQYAKGLALYHFWIPMFTSMVAMGAGANFDDDELKTMMLAGPLSYHLLLGMMFKGAAAGLLQVTGLNEKFAVGYDNTGNLIDGYIQDVNSMGKKIVAAMETPDFEEMWAAVAAAGKVGDITPIPAGYLSRQPEAMYKILEGYWTEGIMEMMGYSSAATKIE